MSQKPNQDIKIYNSIGSIYQHMTTLIFAFRGVQQSESFSEGVLNGLIYAIYGNILGYITSDVWTIMTPVILYSSNRYW